MIWNQTQAKPRPDMPRLLTALERSQRQNQRLDKQLVVAARGHPATLNRRVFDPRTVASLGRNHCTSREMASILQTSEQVINERMTEIIPEAKAQCALLPKDWGKFRRAYERGMANTDRSLRSKQIDMALAGNVTMLIHLGRHRLGQIPASEMAREQASAGVVTFTIAANPGEVEEPGAMP